MLTSACEPQLCMDITKEAGFFSQLSGILAGFAFAALTLIISMRFTVNGDDQSGEVEDICMAFIASMVTLIICTAIAAEVASEISSDARATVASWLLGMVMTISVIMLFYAITLLLMHARLARSLKLARWVTGLGVPIFCFEFLTVGSEQIDAQRKIQHLPTADAAPFAAVVLAIMVSILLPLLVVKREFRWEGILKAGPVATCLIAIICLMAQAAMTNLSSDYVPPRWADYVSLTMAAFLICFLGLVAGRVRIPSAPIPS